MNSTAAERLDQYLADENAPFDLSEIAAGIPEGSTVEQKFSIQTKEQANWALRKIAAIERGRQEALAAARAEIARIQAWLTEEEKRADQAREYLDFLLEDYHRRQLAENPKAKTIKLLHGELQLRAQQPEFQRDEAAIKTWAKDNRPEALIPQEPKLDWAGLKKHLVVQGGRAVDPTTGEVVPGIAVIERPEKFSIKLQGV